MARKKYQIRLTPEQRLSLIDLVSKGKASAKAIMHANVLLSADENNPSSPKKEVEIAELFHVHPQTVFTIRKQYFENGLEAAITRKKRETPPVKPRITGDVEAKIIALSCTTPPNGQTRWTLRLLANKAVELQYIDSISYESVSTLLKKRTQAASS